jgi:hypothetical protein
VLEKYEVSEKRILTVRKGSERLDLEVPFDFEVTQEWLDSQFENPEMTKCLNWLEAKGFVKGESGRWNLYKTDKSHHIKLPQFFMDFFYSKLRVSFGIVEANSFYFPRPDRAYSSMEEFPKFLPKKCTVDMNNSWYMHKRISWVDYTSLEVLKYFVENNCKGDLNGLYYQECCNRYFSHKASLERVKNSDYRFKSPGITITGGIPIPTEEEQNEKLRVEKCRSFYNKFKEMEDMFNMNEKFVNIKRSSEGIKKFQL